VQASTLASTHLSSNSIHHRTTANMAIMHTTIIENHDKPPPQEQSVIAEVLLPLDRSQDVLRLVVVESGFLTLKEIGRVLTCTSKSITHCLYSDANDLWTFLLKQRCSFDQENLSASKMSSKQIFHSTFEQVKSRPPMLIRDLCYSPHDYIIMVNIRYKDDGRAFFSKTIPGKDIPEFFDNGRFCLSDFSCDPFDDDDDNMEMNVYVHRIVDNNVICLFESENADCWDDDALAFSSYGNLEMADLVYSQHLFDVLLDSEHYDGFDVEVDLELDRCEETGRCHISSLDFKVRLDINDDYEDFPQNNDVTFAHFLENMYAWDK
jgi:hypothetical protein